MKRAIAGIGVCAGLLSVGAVLTAAPAGADCTDASMRAGCESAEKVASTETVTVTRTRTTTSTTTTTTTRTKTVTATVTRTRTAASGVVGDYRGTPDGPAVVERPN